MTTMIYGGYSETFTYNERGQLTNLTATGNGLASVNLQYKFAAFPNNDGERYVNHTPKVPAYLGLPSGGGA